MIRTCPKCGDYYADASLAFCLADGTPLVNVDPLSERWREGARVIEGKEKALRKQKRKLKRRRVVLSAMTLVLVIMVVSVVAVNSLLYLRPEQEETALNTPLTPATEPRDSSTPVTPNPAQTPRPTLTPKPAASPTTKEVKPPTRDAKPAATPTPTPNTHPPTQSPTFTPTQTPLPICSDADKSRERKIIIERYGDIWRRSIEGDRRKMLAENFPVRAENGAASLGTIEFESTFSKSCTKASITVRYVWQVRTNLNGTIRVVPIAKQRKFACEKIGTAWSCS